LVDKKNLKKDEAIFNVLREYIKTSKKIRFDGDGYSKEWENEAKKRKLSNNKNTPEALQVLSAKETLDLYKSVKVMSEVEVNARKEVELDAYIMHLQIEGRIYSELVYNHIIPSAITYQNTLIKNVTGLKEIYGAAHKGFSEGQLSMIEEMGEHLNKIKIMADAMNDAMVKVDLVKDSNKKALGYCNTILPYFSSIRGHADALENLIDDQLWPLTKYRELLFIK